MEFTININNANSWRKNPIQVSGRVGIFEPFSADFQHCMCRKSALSPMNNVLRVPTLFEARIGFDGIGSRLTEWHN
jgi:hypothetical protein